jgi:hypothetical protein
VEVRMTLTVEERPGAPQRQISRRQMNLVFGTVLLGMLLSALDQTIVSTALPDDRRRPGWRRAHLLGRLVLLVGRHRGDRARRQVR